MIRTALVPVVVLAGMVAACAAPQESAPTTASAEIPPASASPTACLPADSVECRLAALGERASDGSFNGIILIAKDGEVIWHRAFGKDTSGKPMALDTPLDIASAGKMFTAVAAAQLVQAGKLSFDDKIGDYRADLPSDVRSASIGQLLSHTSGLPMNSASKGLDRVPGTFSYSNAGFDLVAQAVEQASGDPFHRFLATNIFTPAGMEATSLEPGPLGSPSGRGGEVSTTADLLRFSEALFAHRLLDEVTTSEVTSMKVETDFGGYGYGFGIFTGEAGEQPSVGHLGALAEIVADVEINPAVGYTMVVLCQSGYGNIRPELIAFEKAVGMGYWRG